jgi:hypothetical protein
MAVEYTPPVYNQKRRYRELTIMTDTPKPNTKDRARIKRSQHNKENPYFMTVRETAQDESISYAALGLLTYLLSKPDHWEVIIGDLKRKKCGRDKARSILKELTDAGYIVHHPQEKDENNQFTPAYYDVYESPCTENPSTESPSTGNPTLDNTELESIEEEKNIPALPDAVSDSGDSDALKSDDQPLTAKSKLNGVDPFADKNATPTSPLIPEDKLPKRTGTRFNMDGTKTPIYDNELPEPKRIVTKESEPIAQEPAANIKAETVEVKTAVQEAAPEAPDEEKPREYDITQAEMFTAICEVLGWDAKNLPGGMPARVGKAATRLRKVKAPLWKMGKMQKWAKKKFGDKWNFAFNLGSPEKVVVNWPTYCGETKDERPIISIQPLEPIPVIPDTGERASPESIAATLRMVEDLARKQSIGYDPITDTTSYERDAMKAKQNE